MKINALAVIALTAVPALASAEDVGLHHARTGAQIAFALDETRLLYTALSARELDVDLTESMVVELASVLAAAKNSAGRASSLLEEKQEKLTGDFEKLRQIIVRAERATQALATTIETEVKPFLAQGDDDEGDTEELAEEKAPAEAVAEPNWGALKENAAWAYFDLVEAKALAGKLSRKVKAPKARAPKKPKGKRPE